MSKTPLPTSLTPPRTRHRCSRNLNSAQGLQRQDDLAPTLLRGLRPYDYLQSGTSYFPERLAFLTITGYTTPTNITPKKTLRPFDSIGCRIRTFTGLSDVVPMRRYR